MQKQSNKKIRLGYNFILISFNSTKTKKNSNFLRIKIYQSVFIVYKQHHRIFHA